MGVNLVTRVWNFSIHNQTISASDHDVQDGCVTPDSHKLRHENLSLEGRLALEKLLSVNKRLNTVLQRRAYGLRDEEYLRFKVLTCMLPAL